MYEILANPMWDGISGIVAIATALVPIVIYLTRRSSLAGMERGAGPVTVDQPRPMAVRQDASPVIPRVQGAQSGCGRTLTAVVLNCGVWMIHSLMTVGFSASIIMSSEEYQEKWKRAMSQSWDRFGENFAFGCALAFIIYPLIFLILLFCTFVSLRLGPANGAYATATGNTIIYALNALLCIPLYGENSLHVPQFLADVAAFLFVVAVIWSSSFAVKQTSVPAG